MSNEYREGELNVWVWRDIQYLGPLMKRIPVESLNEAANLINELVKRDLQDKLITANAMGLEIYKNGEWEEWGTEQFDDIHEYIDFLML